MLAADVALVTGVTLVFLSVLPLSSVFALEADPPAFAGLLPWLPIGLYLVAFLAWLVWVTRYRYRPDDAGAR